MRNGWVVQGTQENCANTSYTDQQKIEMLEKAKQHGWSTSQAADEFNVTSQTIRNWCEKFGIVLARVRKQ